MAKNAEVAAFHHGDMPIKDHSDTYRSVMGLFKWGALGVACLLTLLTIWFCTPGGFLPAAVVAVIMLVAGVVGLRARATQSH